MVWLIQVDDNKDECFAVHCCNLGLSS